MLHHETQDPISEIDFDLVIAARQPLAASARATRLASFSGNDFGRQSRVCNVSCSCCYEGCGTLEQGPCLGQDLEVGKAIHTPFTLT